jgi:hypothetical protein
MQAVDGPNSSQLEWHQDGVKTNGPNSSQLEWHQIGVKTNAPDTKIRLGTVSGGKVTSRLLFAVGGRNAADGLKITDVRLDWCSCCGCSCGLSFSTCPRI